MNGVNIGVTVTRDDGTPVARISIRSSTYHSEAGFTISGTDAYGRRANVFTPGTDRADAEAVKANLLDGRPPFDGPRWRCSL